MRKSRYTDSQILAILKQNEEGAKDPDLCREHGMSAPLFYRWRAKFGGMGAALMKRMKELEEENRRLKNQNAYIERFNRTVRHEWVDLHLFESVQQAQHLAMDVQQRTTQLCDRRSSTQPLSDGCLVSTFDSNGEWRDYRRV